MEKQVPNYLRERGIYQTDKKNILTDEEHEKLRNLQADKGIAQLDNGDYIRAIYYPPTATTSPCTSCYFKEKCVPEKGEEKNPPLYMRMCLSVKRPDKKPVKFVKI